MTSSVRSCATWLAARLPTTRRVTYALIVEGGGGGDEGGCEGGDGGDQGEGGGDGGCSRGTAHQVGRSRANWQSTVWLVRLIKDYNGDEGDKSVEDAWWREVGALSMGIKYEW